MIDSETARLRKKLGDTRDESKHIVAVHGVGYKLII